MADNLAGIPFSSSDEEIDFPMHAKQLLVKESFNFRYGWPVPSLSIREVYIVSFDYILGGWKARLSTSRPDGRYYEMTYNFEKKETYIDVYTKVSNVCIPD